MRRSSGTYCFTYWYVSKSVRSTRSAEVTALLLYLRTSMREQVQRQSKFNGLVTATTLHLQAAQLASLLPIAGV